MAKDMTDSGDKGLEWLDEALQILAGAASMCWEPKPTGVFDPELATEFVEEAKQIIASKLAEAERLAREDELKKINHNYTLGGGWTDPDKRYAKGRNDEQNAIMEYTFSRIKALETQAKEGS